VQWGGGCDASCQVPQNHHGVRVGHATLGHAYHFAVGKLLTWYLNMSETKEPLRSSSIFSSQVGIHIQ